MPFVGGWGKIWEGARLDYSEERGMRLELLERWGEMCEDVGGKGVIYGGFLVMKEVIEPGRGVVGVWRHG